MKAQGIRRALWLVNAVLVAALLGAGAWYVMKVRPASATGTQDAKWAETKRKAYGDEKINQIPIYPIPNEETLNAITRKELHADNIGVGVYVGPPPPEPKPPPEAVKVEGPKDLEAIGTLDAVFKGGKQTVISWEFKDPKSPHRAFKLGEFVRGTEAEPGRFMIMDVVEAPAAPIWKVLFDVYDDPNKPPVRTGQSTIFDLTAKGSGKPAPLRPPGGVETGPGAPPGEPGKVTAAGTAPGDPLKPMVPSVIATVGKVEVIERTGDNYRVGLDDTAYGSLMGGNGESLMEAVKTSVAKDSNGNPKGLMVSDIKQGTLAAQFDVKPGDILLSINGQVVYDRATAVNIVKALPRDTKSVKIVIERNGRQIFYDVDPRDPKVRRAENVVRYGNGTPPK